MEDDLSRYSDPSERQTPSNSARSDLLPVPKLNIHKDKSKKVKKVVPPSARSGNSSHRSGRCDEIPQLDVRFDVDQVRNILKDQIHFGLSSTENETKVKSPRNNENENMNINENMNRNENGSAGTSAPPEKVKSITFRLTETDNVKTEIQL
ncbi:hypothetical protein TRFO_05816 [Tritrichomonas foetus]|uniref:Uncharacterized protein n=1 Tax=Tritrichomonas foetus TaxID=1144522 RepID=A0A1J4K3Y9_9EUKA|nr:hypothetical protein TRFO_05816 [Tritrichomonas foetus]|eukprot:OHT05682.1 hypothetical protein TRFO_05816 [Tritrichomonas foetus]